ncbi:DUF3558 domain-containing protein [Streptomyces sp. NPDC101160]|uniref:DUF3558 domain-containing protein n=1 Tax=Streptomyces sp. NPDC101160 TaxID=3366118 RepID=UPI0037F4DA4D
MQRKAYVLSAVALAVGLGIGLAGCSSGTAADVGAVDSKAGPAAASAAPPGRYRTLFEPCGAVPRATLKDLLPGAAGLPDAERDRVYRGTAAATFDTDRRVGCSWKAATPDATHQLTLDIERVVSYDPLVSDDDRAQQVFASKQTGAGIAPLAPTATPPASPPASNPAAAKPRATPPPSASTDPASAPDAASPMAGQEPAHAPQGPVTPPPARTAVASSTAATPPAVSPSAGLEPRVLDGLGDAAYLDDTLVTTGPSGQQRLVSVVFRTSNVIVTVSYEEQTTSSAVAPDRAELQEKARNLAGLLADRLEE